MESFSTVGIVVTIIAVFVAYFLGVTKGISQGRDKGFNDGKLEGSREESRHAYAVGFDRGKRARDEDDDDDDDESGQHGGGASFLPAAFAVIAGVLALLWFLSQSPETPIKVRDNNSRRTTLPAVGSAGSVSATADSTTADSTTAANSESHQVTTHAFPPPAETTDLPRVNRSLPTVAPYPSSDPSNSPAKTSRGSQRYQTPTKLEVGKDETEIERANVQFPHPPPAFGKSRSYGETINN